MVFDRIVRLPVNRLLYEHSIAFEINCTLVQVFIIFFCYMLKKLTYYILFMLVVSTKADMQLNV